MAYQRLVARRALELRKEHLEHASAALADASTSTYGPEHKAIATMHAGMHVIAADLLELAAIVLNPAAAARAEKTAAGGGQPHHDLETQETDEPT